MEPVDGCGVQRWAAREGGERKRDALRFGKRDSGVGSRESGVGSRESGVGKREAGSGNRWSMRRADESPSLLVATC
ncbi:hypothetical protein D0A35_05185 [Xanthomonas campestris]|nr:hypothetical protein D0A35_05185 [Xanthomonas campestris]